MTAAGAFPRGDSDIELLERLLALQGATESSRSTAEKIIEITGCLSGAIACSSSRLRKFGATDREVETLRLVEKAIATALVRKIDDRPLLDNFEKVLDLCHATLAHKAIEEFWVFFLNNRNRLISLEMMWTGTVNQAAAYPREVMARALDLYASAMVLVHNHPSGEPAPSRDDIQMTRQIVDAGKVLGITVHDHIVVGRSGSASMHSLGLM